MQRLILVLSLALLAQGHPDLECEDMDNGQRSYNPMLRESKCARQCFVCDGDMTADDADDDGDMTACSGPETQGRCAVDDFVGSYVLIENDHQRIWNFSLRP